MNPLLRESDVCLELVEQAILAGCRRLPPRLLARLARLSEAAGHRRTRPPDDPVGAHEFVFEVQGERLLSGAPVEEAASTCAGRRQPARLRVRRRGPLFGSLGWLEARPVALAVDPEWAWEVWREAADLARLQPTPGRAAAMQEAWAYYWALTGLDEEATEPAAKRAA